MIQNKLAGFNTFSALDTKRCQMYHQLEWMTVNQLICYHTLLTVYRVRTTGEPEDLATCPMRYNRNGNIIIPQSNMELYRKAFLYRAVNSWNEVTKNIRNIPIQRNFKKHVKTWILEEI